MRLDQGEELLPAPEHLSGAAAELRVDQGQRLDAARAEFRAEWQVKVDRKRRQAERTRRTEERFSHAPRAILITGAALGACNFALIGALQSGLPDFIMGALIGCIFGLLGALPVALLALFGYLYYYNRAARLEQELREMERS